MNNSMKLGQKAIDMLRETKGDVYEGLKEQDPVKAADRFQDVLCKIDKVTVLVMKLTAASRDD